MKTSALLVPLAIFADKSLHEIPTTGESTSAASLLASSHICDYDHIIVATCPGLTTDDLYGMPSSSLFAQQFKQSSLRVLDSRSFETDSLASQIAQKCNLPVVSDVESSSVASVTSVTLPDVETEQSSRREAVSEALSSVTQKATNWGKSTTSTIIILEGAPPSEEAWMYGSQKRADNYIPDSPFFHQVAASLSSSNNSTLILHGGLFARYQFLTPSLLLAVLVSVLVLFPILWVGVSALSSIEIPSNMGDIAKSERKS